MSMMPNETDVLIIGGAPGGCSAAIALKAFKALYYINSILTPRRTLEAWRQRAINIEPAENAG